MSPELDQALTKLVDTIDTILTTAFLLLAIYGVYVGWKYLS